MPKSVDERIAAIEKRQSELAARKNMLTAKKKREDRVRDTRRKIVVGGAVLAAIARDPNILPALQRILSRSVTRPIDREVIADLLPPPHQEAK